MTLSLADEIRALDQLDTLALALRYEELIGKPPRRRFPQYLRKRIAYALQERDLGGLSIAARKRIHELAAEIKLPLFDKKVERKPKVSAPSPGTVLKRTWKGREETVLVRADGFEWQEQIYRSLSAVASAITGSRWNGYVFFHLNEKGVAS